MSVNDKQTKKEALMRSIVLELLTTRNGKEEENVRSKRKCGAKRSS